jgi:hypothetical protein
VAAPPVAAPLSDRADIATCRDSPHGPWSGLLPHWIGGPLPRPRAAVDKAWAFRRSTYSTRWVGGFMLSSSNTPGFAVRR